MPGPDARGGGWYVRAIPSLDSQRSFDSVIANARAELVNERGGKAAECPEQGLQVRVLSSISHHEAHG